MASIREERGDITLQGDTQNMRDACKTLRGYLTVIGILNWSINSLLLMILCGADETDLF